MSSNESVPASQLKQDDEDHYSRYQPGGVSEGTVAADDVPDSQNPAGSPRVSDVQKGPRLDKAHVNRAKYADDEGDEGSSEGGSKTTSTKSASSSSSSTTKRRSSDSGGSDSGSS